MTTDNPTPLLDANFRWIAADGRPVPEFYQYFRALDKTVRTAVGVINIPSATDLRNVYLEVACSSEDGVLEAGTAKVTFRMPFAMTVSEVRASLKTAQASGSIFTVDINEGGTSILSTTLTIDNGEKTSTTAATAAVISDADVADDAEMTVDIDQVGDGTAAGLKIVLIGSRPAPE